MPSYDTHGWDAVVELGEPELDDLLACRFATGELQLPAGGEHRFGHASIDLKLLYDTPQARLVTDAGPGNDPGVRLVVPFDESFVRYNVPFGGRDEPIRGRETDLRGEVHYTAPVRLRRDEDSHRLVLATGDATAAVEFGPETRSHLSDDGAVFADIYEATVENPDPAVENDLRNLPATVSERVEQWVTDEAGTALPTTELAVSVEADDATVEVVDGPTSHARCLVVAGDLSERTTSHDRFDTCTRPAGTSAALAVSTDFLLSEVVCPRVADRLNLAASDFEPPCRLASPTKTTISARGQSESFVLDSLSVTVEDGDVVIDGEVSAERGPADISGSLDVRIDVTYEAGDLLFSVVTSDVEITVDVPWYVEVASWFSPRLQFAINTLPDLVEAAAEEALSTAGSANIEASERLHAFLDDRFDSMEVDAFDLTRDALVAGGSLLPDQHCPPEAAGTVRLSPGAGIDLDAGETTATDFVEARDVDLRWGDPADSTLGWDVLAPRHGAQTTVLGTAIDRRGDFETTDVVALDSLRDRRWDDDPIPETDLFFPQLPHVGQRGLLFGTFTSEGRYAKCSAHVAGGGRLHLRYYTYQRPTPDLRLGVDSVLIESEQVESGVEHWTEVECTPGGPGGPQVTTRHRSSEYTVFERAYRVEATASATRLAWPLNFEWSLAGEPLSGTGTVTVDGTAVHHEVAGATCTLTPEDDGEVAGTLTVEVTDTRDLTVRRHESVVIREEAKEGGRPPNVEHEQRREIERCRTERELTGPDGWPDSLGPVGPGDAAVGAHDRPEWTDPRVTHERFRRTRARDRSGRATDSRGSLSPGETRSDDVRRALAAGMDVPTDRLDGDDWP